MLRKLLKYDLKWDYKVLSALYLLAVSFCLITRGLQSISNTSVILQFFAGFFSIISYALVANVLINTFTRLMVRFIRNLYKDESYLTHTLPVDKKQIYLSKFISSMICTFTSFLVVILCLFILLYSAENMAGLKQMLESITVMYNTNITSFLLAVAVAGFLEMGVLLVIMYTAIIVGHKAEDNKILKSIGWGVLFFMITQIGILAFGFLVGVWNKEIVDIFISTNMPSIQTIKTVMGIVALGYAIAIMVYYCIGNRQLKKGVNVE